jgi:hypothetical protein
MPGETRWNMSDRYSYCAGEAKKSSPLPGTVTMVYTCRSPECLAAFRRAVADECRLPATSHRKKKSVDGRGSERTRYGE